MESAFSRFYSATKELCCVMLTRGSELLPPLIVKPPPPPPPFPGCSDIVAEATYAESWGKPTIDQVWVLREHYEQQKNKRRSADWETRFKVLGPFPESN